MIQNVRVRGLRPRAAEALAEAQVLKIKEFTLVNDCFQNKHNEEIGHYGQTLINEKYYFDFYSPEYVRFEIFKHKEKIKSFGKLTDNEFIEVYNLIQKNITVLNHSIIPTNIYKESELI